MVSRTCISVGDLRVLGNSVPRLELPQGRGSSLIEAHERFHEPGLAYCFG